MLFVGVFKSLRKDLGFLGRGFVRIFRYFFRFSGISVFSRLFWDVIRNIRIFACSKVCYSNYRVETNRVEYSIVSNVRTPLGYSNSVHYYQKCMRKIPYFPYAPRSHVSVACKPPQKSVRWRYHESKERNSPTLVHKTQVSERATSLLTPDWPITNGFNNMQPIAGMPCTNAICRRISAVYYAY